MLKKLLAILVSGLFATIVSAEPLIVTFTGQWWAQANTLVGGAKQVPISVPIDFTATMIIDPDINSFETFAINANYLTRFPSVSIFSAITEIGLANPFGPIYSSASYASVSRYSASYSPYKIESSHFGFRELSGIDFSGGGSGEWQLQFRIDAPNIGVSIIRPINSIDLKASLEAAKLGVQQYNIFYEKSATVYNTSAITGYPYTGYIGGIQLNGSARITAITAVPELSSLTMLSLGLFAIAAISLRRRIIGGAKNRLRIAM